MKSLSPPIISSDGMIFGSLDELLGWFCLPTDVDDSPEAFDARGRRITLAAVSDDEPIKVSFAEEETPEELQEVLRKVVRQRHARIAPVDPEASTDDVLRALWAAQQAAPYPRDIQ